MRTSIEQVERIEKRNKPLGRLLRLYLERKQLLKQASLKDLVETIVDRLGVKSATAYDYAHALRLLVDYDEPEDYDTVLDRPLHYINQTGIRNRFDAIRILSGMTDPPLVAKMKEYARNLWQDILFGGRPFPCDYRIFEHELGLLLEKVGNFALYDPDFVHAPKALAEACLIEAVEEVDPRLQVSGIDPPVEARRFVQWVQYYRRKRRKPIKEWVEADSEKSEYQQPRITIVRSPSRQCKVQQLRGLDLWFLHPGEPVANALIKYCQENSVHWEKAVKDLLSSALKTVECL